MSMTLSPLATLLSLGTAILKYSFWAVAVPLTGSYENKSFHVMFDGLKRLRLLIVVISVESGLDGAVVSTAKTFVAVTDTLPALSV